MTEQETKDAGGASPSDAGLGGEHWEPVCTAELNVMMKDAARYRWLRENPTWIGYDSDVRPDEVDSVIDTVMTTNVERNRAALAAPS